LWLLEPRSSAYVARIEAASAEAGLSVASLATIEAAPHNAALIGVGPSISDPLGVARELRGTGSEAMLVFFTASSGARDALRAELLRDPFLYPRFEIVDLPNTTHQLASQMDKVISQVEHRQHLRRSSRRGRGRTRASAAAASGVVLDAKHQAELLNLIREGLASGEPREGQLPYTNASGQTLELTVSVEPVHDEAGNTVGASLVVRPDSEYQRIQEALREANRQKGEFLAIMSHELRTPLTSILGYTDMLLRGLAGPLTPLSNKYVSNVRAAGDRLLDLVNGLLDYTRLEAGVERLELKPVDLGHLATQIVHLCRSAAQTKELDLHVDVREDFDASVEADEERISHVVRSMLGNALKFTPAGGWVRIHVEPDQQPQGVRVSVTDSGIGMRPDQIGRVWERFYQGDASLTRPYGGMGLGLSIARHLVSLHGGRVGAESGGPGRGSTFWFSLPRHATS